MIDFQFKTPSGEILYGPYTAPTTNSYDALVLSFNDSTKVRFILDTDFAGAMVKEGGGNADTVGDHVHQFKARLPSNDSVVLTRSSANGIKLVKTANGNTFGLTTSDTGSYESMSDTLLGFSTATTGSFFILWETSGTLPSLENIARIPDRFDLCQYSNKLQFRDNGGGYTVALQNILASTPYIIEVQWSPNGSNFDYTLKLTKLSTGANVETSATVTNIDTPRTGLSKELHIGNAQTTLDSTFCSMVMTRDDATARSRAKVWLDGKWRGNETEVPNPDPNGVAADFQVVLNFV
jgi:hypothetical protein